MSRRRSRADDHRGQRPDSRRRPVNYGTATLTNCTVSGNSADSGGGLYNYGTATLTNCTVSGNTAGRYGGGLDNRGTAR